MPTVQEINQMLADNHKSFVECEEQLKNERRQALKKERFDEGARDFYEAYRSFIEQGFTGEQAWELLKIIVINNK
jgi:hypothetical protein